MMKKPKYENEAFWIRLNYKINNSHLSLSELAKKAGLTSRYCLNRIKNYQCDVAICDLINICTALNTTVYNLIKDDNISILLSKNCKNADISEFVYNLRMGEYPQIDSQINSRISFCSLIDDNAEDEYYSSDDSPENIEAELKKEKLYNYKYNKYIELREHDYLHQAKSNSTAEKINNKNKVTLSYFNQIAISFDIDISDLFYVLERELSKKYNSA